MRSPIRASVISAIALVTMLAGCERKTAENNHSTAPTPSTSTSSTAPTIPNLITEQTAGKPPLKLKLGEPASFTKGGVTLTLTPKSVEFTNGPIGNVKDSDNKFDCGQWWTVSLELKIDVQANSTWNGWMLNFNAPLGLAGKIRKDGEEYVGEGMDSAITDSSADISNELNKVIYDFDANRKQEFHRTLNGVDHIAACVRDNDQRIPSDRKPTALDWGMEIDPNDNSGHWPQLAVWFL